MNFELTEERQMVQDSLRRFLQSEYSQDLIREQSDTETGFSHNIWSSLAELGITGALFSEADGGYGGTGFDIALVFEELGRVGALEPLLDTAVLAGSLPGLCGDDRHQSLIESIMDGSVQLALAHAEPRNRYELSRVETRARREADEYVLDGHKAVVVNAPAADHIIISARTAGDVDDDAGICLFLVPVGSKGIELQSYTISSGARASELVLDGVRVPVSTLLGKEGEASSALEYAHAKATVALCAEAVGLMESIKDLTVNYLKVRNQFGQALGKFQVLQHRMADMLIEMEQARSALINIAGHLDAPRQEREKHVSAAKNLIGEVSKLVVEESIQMHGGIGITMEYELAHLVRRLVMVDHRFGDTTHHLERFIDLAVA